MRRILLYLPFLLLLMLVPATAAWAAENPPAQPGRFPIPPDQLWAIIAGAVVALPTYTINKFFPYTDEKIKGIVHLVTAAIAGGITQAIVAGNVGFNDDTLQFVIAAVVGVIGIQSFWKKSGIGIAFGQGQNKPDQTPGPLQVPPA